MTRTDRILSKFLLSQKEANGIIYIDSFSIEFISIHLNYLEKRYFKKNKKDIIKYLFDGFQLNGYKKIYDCWKTFKRTTVTNLEFHPVE